MPNYSWCFAVTKHKDLMVHWWCRVGTWTVPRSVFMSLCDRFRSVWGSCSFRLSVWLLECSIRVVKLFSWRRRIFERYWFSYTSWWWYVFDSCGLRRWIRVVVSGWICGWIGSVFHGLLLFWLCGLFSCLVVCCLICVVGDLMLLMSLPLMWMICSLGSWSCWRWRFSTFAIIRDGQLLLTNSASSFASGSRLKSASLTRMSSTGCCGLKGRRCILWTLWFLFVLIFRMM